MKITLKLFASLGEYLPPNAERNTVEMEAPEGSTIAEIIERIGLPHESVKLVFVDGVHQWIDELHRRTIQPGETLAIWPPVAGG
uniref:Molybdopterin converting factor, small subunit n=1 Tax=Candidatus Kentrum sp. LPFa TaxID=2126335 RepID=A0A450XAE2_9GAMM|nr:MAG: Molybdopterin converting factor, small subunit [Candidatus Kentron sp. LPFa]VFK26161.1 MAG: Molybdopterin converting factor, small subunit [Candidatus Kentron sp. LPFa]